MKYQINSIAVAFRDHKTAALYFDSIIIPTPFIFGGTVCPSDIIQYLAPPELRDTDLLAKYQNALESANNPDTLPVAWATRNNEYWHTTVDCYAACSEIVQHSDIRGRCSFFGEHLTASNLSSACPSLVLSNLDLVDESQLTWEQVIAIRQDKKATDQLRNLRRMLFKDYEGKPLHYIQDDIEFRLAEYRDAVRLWNLPTLKGSLEVALTSDAIAIGAATLALALFGMPIGAAIATGAAASFSKIALLFAGRLREVDIEARRNAVSYLYKLERATGQQIGA